MSEPSEAIVKLTKIQEMIRSKDPAEATLGENVLWLWKERMKKIQLSFFEEGCCYRVVLGLSDSRVCIRSGVFVHSKLFGSRHILYFKYMNEEQISKINDLLISRNKAEKDLGLQMVKTHVRNTNPVNVYLEEGRDYLVTFLHANDSHVGTATIVGFERRVHHYDSPTNRKHMLRFVDIESKNVLEITPIAITQ